MKTGVKILRLKNSNGVAQDQTVNLGNAPKHPERFNHAGVGYLFHTEEFEPRYNQTVYVYEEIMRVV